MLNDTLIVDMAIDGDGVIYLVDFRDLQRDLSQIRRLDKFGTELSLLKSSELDLPIFSVEVGPMGNIYYRTAGLVLIGVGRFEPNGNELDPLMQDRSVIGIGFDGYADVFVGFTENNGSTVERLSNDGSPIEVVLDDIIRPSEIAFDSQGNMLVLDDRSSSIHVVDSAGEFLGLLNERPFGFSAKDFVIGPTGLIYIGGQTNISVMNGVHGELTPFATVGHSITAGPHRHCIA